MYSWLICELFLWLTHLWKANCPVHESQQPRLPKLPAHLKVQVILLSWDTSIISRISEDKHRYPEDPGWGGSSVAGVPGSPRRQLINSLYSKWWRQESFSTCRSSEDPWPPAGNESRVFCVVFCRCVQIAVASKCSVVQALQKSDVFAASALPTPFPLAGRVWLGGIRCWEAAPANSFPHFPSHYLVFYRDSGYFI